VSDGIDMDDMEIAQRLGRLFLFRAAEEMDPVKASAHMEASRKAYETYEQLLKIAAYTYLIRKESK
jgi:hypothetical protein